jgi:hypothetical protein
MPINKIQSNTTGLAFAEESVIGVLPGVAGADAIWRAVEPNSYADFGGNITTVARSPINQSRQQQKGSVTDLEASVGFNHDFQTNTLTRLLQSFFFAKARQTADTRPLDSAQPQIAITAATATTFTAAAGLGVFKPRDLVQSSGFANPVNNGLKLLSASAAGVLTTTGNAVEAAPPAGARIKNVGVEFVAGDVDITLTGASAVNLASTAYNFNTLPLIVGAWVFLGGDVTGNRFVDNVGYARVSAISTNLLSFDQTTWTPAAEVGAGKTIRIFFGDVLRNEKLPSLIVTKSLQFERQIGDAGAGVQSEYVSGCVGNEFTLNLTTADKMTCDMSFVGINNTQRTGAQGLKAGTRVAIVPESAYNTSSHIYRQRLAVVDPANINNPVLVGFVMDGTLKIGNGVTLDKALGVLGGFDVSIGDFMTSGNLQAYFTTVEAVAAVRANLSLNYNVILARENSGVIYDVPLLTVAGGRANVEKDKPVMLPLDSTGFENPNGYTLLSSIFSYLPTAAMPL